MEIEHKITEEMLQGLFQGKKLVLDYAGQPRITLYPPRYGVFMTHEKFVELERRAQMNAYEAVVELFREARKESNQ